MPLGMTSGQGNVGVGGDGGGEGCEHKAIGGAIFWEDYASLAATANASTFSFI